MAPNRIKQLLEPTTVLLSFVAVAVTFCFCSSATAREAKVYADIKMTPDSAPESLARGEMRAEAQEAADLLNIKPMVSKLRDAQINGAPDSKSLQYARMLCLLRMTAAMQEVRKFVAVCQFDLASSNIALRQLMGKRQRTISMITTLNFAQAGILGITKQSLSLHGEFQAAQYPGVVGFSDSTALSLLTLLVPSVFKVKIDQPRNTLGNVFNPEFRPADADRSYLWKFFNAKIPNSKFDMTRRELLIYHWRDYQGLGADDKSRQRRLAAEPKESDENLEDIRLIAQRIELLQDLKSHAEEFDTSLNELHKAIALK